MNYDHFTTDDQTKFKYVVLMPTVSTKDVLREYVQPFGLVPEQVCVLSLHTTGKRTPVKVMKEYCKELFEAFTDMQTRYVIVSDANYYKVLTGEKKAEANLGYVKEVNGVKFVYVPSIASVFYDPPLRKPQIAQSMNALLQDERGKYIEPGSGIIKDIKYPRTVDEIYSVMQHIIDRDQDVACDIEAFSLKHYDAGIGTISFALNQKEAWAFEVDWTPTVQTYLVDPKEYTIAVRAMLKEFFIHFQHKIIFHNASYDVTVLIYQLFMDHIEDQAGLLYGLEMMMPKVHCSKLVAYLATNTCAGNTLGLKPLSQEFSGNYSIDEIKDITRIEISELLRYNAIDTLSTWYVWDKYYPIMVADEQEPVYLDLFLPSLVDIIQMQLTGMPLDMDAVAEAKRVMTVDCEKAVAEINAHPKIQEFVYQLKEKLVVKKNAEYKKKVITIDDLPDSEFNPNSDPQLQGFLYEFLGLPVPALTDSGQPSTKGAHLKSLKNKITDESIKGLIDSIMDFKDVIIILNTFISAFEKARQGPSGQFYLFGFFNLGGTVSGRLSSNGPNLQNIPSSGSKYSKIIKKCFVSIAGWIFAGLDFASLEDRISALTTKDPNKLKVYTDGFDGHSLRAYSYFGENMPDIDADSVESINSISKKYPAFRQDSKVPTFLLTYGGTHIGIMDKMGWPLSKALLISTRYHEMYIVSDQWVQAKLDEAGKTGYVTVAFGLRVRTPLLKQVIRGTRVTPYEAEAEGRTAGNALGQSWGLLNNRAVTEFMRKVRAHPVYRYWVRPCAQIHDANYYILKDDPELIVWVNHHLSEAVKWQDHPDIWHDEVKLGGELDLFYPSWAENLTLPNELDVAGLLKLCQKHLEPKEKK